MTSQGKLIGPRIAAIATCHNRRDQTLACLERLMPQLRAAGGRLYLVDDGSVDGTAAAVRRSFPDVVLLSGDGSLFWNGGMRLAESRALADEPQYVLWVNDDVRLDDDALQHLLDLATATSGLIVGPCRDPQTGGVSYGGVRRFRGLKFGVITPNGAPQACDTMNGNVVLIPAHVVRSLGGLDRAFKHTMADFDFGLRARRQEYDIWSLGQPVGSCSRGGPAGTSEDPTATALVRLRRRISIKELPLGMWCRFARRWAGPAWPVYFVSPYIMTLIRRRSVRLAAPNRTSANGG